MILMRRLRAQQDKEEGVLSKSMARIEELESAIDGLSVEEYKALRHWFRERDSEIWDRQIAADAASGKLNHLVQQAQAAKANGTLRLL
jgi:hypothetical protein